MKTGFRMKRFVLALTALLLSVSLCSCYFQPRVHFTNQSSSGSAQDAPSQTDEAIGYQVDEDGCWTIERPDYTRSPLYEPVTTPYSYLHLTERGERFRSLYGRMEEAVYCLTDHPCDDYEDLYDVKPVVLSGVYTREEVESALISVLDDEPEIFWMTSDIKLTTDEKKQETTVELQSSYTPQQVVRMMDGLNTALSTFFSGITANMTPYEREEYVYTYLIDHCAYDKSVNDSDDYGYDHPAIYDMYGVMVEGKAVCEGYSRAFDYLCSQLGIDTVCVGGILKENGEIKELLHSWNAVKLDGEWYWADVTWDDWDEENEDTIVYLYLNLDDKTMFLDHELFRTYDQYTAEEYEALTYTVNTFLPPACTATKYSYILRESVKLTDIDSDELVDGIVQAADNGYRVVYVYVEPSAYTLKQAEELLFAGEQPYYRALEQANERLTSVRLDTDSEVAYYVYDERNLLVFELNYKER